MTDIYQQIRELIALGDKATQGKMEVNHRYEEVTVGNGKRDFAHTTMDGDPFYSNDSQTIDYWLDFAKRDAEFIAAAANARPALKALIEENAALKIENARLMIKQSKDEQQ